MERPKLVHRVGEKIRNNPAETAWIALGTAALAYEIAAPDGQLLSHAADRAMDRHPLLTRAAVGALSLHLINALPYEADVISLLGKRLNRYKRRAIARDGDAE